MAAYLIAALVVQILISVSAYPAVEFASKSFQNGYAYEGTCPGVSEIQDKWVTQNFDIKKFEGAWYELAFHDYTQPRFCKCMQSYKKYDPVTNPKILNDYFYLNCVGSPQEPLLEAELTESVGVFMVHWSFVPNVVFPNMVVDIKTDENGDYIWVIEFQCIDVENFVVFTGINFYHRSNHTDEATLKEMFLVARDHGLGEFMDTGFGVTIVDHSDCSYPYTLDKKNMYHKMNVTSTK